MTIADAASIDGKLARPSRKIKSGLIQVNARGNPIVIIAPGISVSCQSEKHMRRRQLFGSAAKVARD